MDMEPSIPSIVDRIQSLISDPRYFVSADSLEYVELLGESSDRPDDRLTHPPSLLAQGWVDSGA